MKESRNAAEEPILNNLSELDAFLVRSPRKSGQQKQSCRTVFVVGCIVKEMKLRPSVLKELANEVSFFIMLSRRKAL